ncbi:MAG: hypothetical protein FWD34_05925 [Oscillospiraceae bacterium]|nr:hypothetical protein [Oscillospiraceae bacterium]
MDASADGVVLVQTGIPAYIAVLVQIGVFSVGANCVRPLTPTLSTLS